MSQPGVSEFRQTLVRQVEVTLPTCATGPMSFKNSGLTSAMIYPVEQIGTASNEEKTQKPTDVQDPGSTPLLFTVWTTMQETTGAFCTQGPHSVDRKHEESGGG